MRVGIDLGTTYSTVAYFDKNLQKPMIIKNKYGSNITPSVVGFTRDGKAKYGDDAKELQEFNEGDTASFYKREMGNTAFKLKLNDSTYRWPVNPKSCEFCGTKVRWTHSRLFTINVSIR